MRSAGSALEDIGGAAGKKGVRGMKKYTYTVLLERAEKGGYRAFCPALTGCRAYGDTKKEAIQNIKLSIRYRMDEYAANGKAIPVDCDQPMQ
jgi:predicted RNase H-like HicB family nuclease